MQRVRSAGKAARKVYIVFVLAAYCFKSVCVCAGKPCYVWRRVSLAYNAWLAKAKSVEGILQECSIVYVLAISTMVLHRVPVHISN
jgi:hypothetical protein